VRKALTADFFLHKPGVNGRGRLKLNVEEDLF